MVIRPISVIRESKINDRDFGYVISAIKSFLKFFKVADKIPVTEPSIVTETGKDFGEFLTLSRLPIRPAELIDANRMSNLILKAAHKLRAESFDNRPYLVAVVDRDLRWHGKNWQRIFGICWSANVAMITVRAGPDKYVLSSEERIKMVTMHELGHLFGLIPNDRTTEVVEDVGRHCANWCIMHADTLPPAGSSGELLNTMLLYRFCCRCRFFLHECFKKDETAGVAPKK